MPHHLDHLGIVPIDKLQFLWEECRPNILVVTDGLNYHANDGFGLTRFVDRLRATPVDGMLPKVTTASLGASTGADLESFNFTTANNGLTIGRYDVVFLFGVAGETVPAQAGSVDAIKRFMQAGGGVFATGDHEDLGASMCSSIPRVRKMRYWLKAETPNVANQNRLSTNLSGADPIFTFNDQSDEFPQRLYANYNGVNQGPLVIWPFPFPPSRVQSAHPLVRLGGGAVLDVFPDHPHEGECRIPPDSSGTFNLDGGSIQEWPGGPFFWGNPFPVEVAKTMSFGNGFDFGPTGPKSAVTPRGFIAIAAYDGHFANVGRVATDATWHHFININLDGTGSSGRTALMPGGVASPDLIKIEQYYSNLMTWLMPVNKRQCLRILRVISELKLYPLFEEIRIPQLDTAKVDELIALGQQFAFVLDQRETGAEGREFAMQTLTGTLSNRAKVLDQLGPDDLSGALADLAFAGLGAVVSSVVESVLDAIKMAKSDKDLVIKHNALLKTSSERAVKVVAAAIERRREQLQSEEKVLAALA